MLKTIANATAAIAAATGISRPWRAIATVTAKRDTGDETVLVEGRANATGRIVELRTTDASGKVAPGPKKPVAKGLVGLTLSDLGLIKRKSGGLTITSVMAQPAKPKAVTLDLRSNALAGI